MNQACTQKKHSKQLLLICIVILLFIPILGSYLRTGSMPPGFSFLASKGLEQPGFSPVVFSGLLLLFLIAFSFLIAPKIYGIQAKSKNTNSLFTKQSTPIKGRLPTWFYVGCALNLSAWVIMWGDYSVFGALTHYMFVPLWAGFILMLDGLLHQRNHNHSFISHHPRQFIAIVLLSIGGWYYFEYINFFVLRNWYYPNLYLIPAPWTYLWAALTYACVWPGIFLIYNLLLTVDCIHSRYGQGPVIALKRTYLPVFFVLGVGLFLLSAVLPSYFFWLIWLGPILILCSTLAYLNMWSPIIELKTGNWSPLLVMALAALCCGFFWEFWNGQSYVNNANYWRYDLPFVHVGEIFEMPVLGYSGYLFFGIECWLMFIACAKILGINTRIDLVHHTDKTQQ